MSNIVYIIVLDKNIHHEGDQRSRDFPGHGYPAWTETVSTSTVYTSYIKFTAAVESHIKRKDKFTAYQAKPYTIKTETTINIKIGD